MAGCNSHKKTSVYRACVTETHRSPLGRRRSRWEEELVLEYKNRFRRHKLDLNDLRQAHCASITTVMNILAL
jgi:hypothetical protein